MARMLFALGLASVLGGSGELAGYLWTGALGCVAVWLAIGPQRFPLL